jgi:hypothetical protein
MTEGTDTPLPTMPAKNKTNPLIISIVVIVVVCCCCFGVAGLVFGFWDPIMQSLQSFGL